MGMSVARFIRERQACGLHLRRIDARGGLLPGLTAVEPFQGILKFMECRLELAFVLLNKGSVPNGIRLRLLIADLSSFE